VFEKGENGNRVYLTDKRKQIEKEMSELKGTIEKLKRDRETKENQENMS
jgi:hypothetical protein